MALTTTTTFMGLVLPVVGQQIGPTWGQNLADAFTAVDSHDHSTGKGTPVSPSGLNITSDLSMKGNGASGNNLTNARTVRFETQGATLGAISTDRRCAYAVGNELYYTDGAGTAVRITLNGGVDTSGSGNITGMGGTTAGVSYSNASKTFTFIQAASTSAHLDVANVTLRDTAVSANGVTLKAPAGIGATYNLTFPVALPAAVNTTLITVTDAGTIAFSLTPTLTARPTFAGVNPGDTADTTNGNVRFNSGRLQVSEGAVFRNLLGWEFLGSVAPLGAAATTLGAVAIAARDHIKVVISFFGNATAPQLALRFNADAGANYTFRYLQVASGGVALTDVNGTGQTSLILNTGVSNAAGYNSVFEILIDNKAANQKAASIVQGECRTGATLPQCYLGGTGHWTNVAAQITSIEFFSSLANGLNVGTCIAIFGRND